jgi:hypothetical protein
MSVSKLSFMTIGFVAAVAACARLEESAGGPRAEFTGPAQPVGGTQVGVAPMVAISPAQVRAMAWVSAPDSGTDGRLYISVNGAPPTEIRDPLGPVEAHGESPPKLAYGPDGSLNAVYVVPKVVPGRRFPLAALRFIRSTDGGAAWTPPVSVTDDADFGTHNFHALLAAGDGTLYVAWLDSRNGKSAAFVTRSTDGGRTWAANHPVASTEACPCCRTALAAASDGAVYVAWREVFPGNVRDIVIARSDDHGLTFGAPVRVHADNWVYNGCPHAGPSVQVDSAGRVHVAWWTGKQGAAGVAYARSDDRAATWSTPVPLGIAEYSQPAHVQLALGAGGVVVAAWDDGTKQVPRIVVRVSDDGGTTFGPAQAVSAEGVRAGFPVLALGDTALTVLWSQENAGTAAEAQNMEEGQEGHEAMLHPVGAAQVMVRQARLDLPTGVSR